MEPRDRRWPLAGFCNISDRGPDVQIKFHRYGFHCNMGLSHHTVVFFDLCVTGQVFMISSCYNYPFRGSVYPIIFQFLVKCLAVDPEPSGGFTLISGAIFQGGQNRFLLNFL